MYTDFEATQNEDIDPTQDTNEEDIDPTQPSTAPIQVEPESSIVEICRLVCTTNQIANKFVLNQVGRRRKQEWTCGRDKQCDIWLGGSKRISKVHFIVWVVSFINCILGQG